MLAGAMRDRDIFPQDLPHATGHVEALRESALERVTAAWTSLSAAEHHEMQQHLPWWAVDDPPVGSLMLALEPFFFIDEDYFGPPSGTAPLFREHRKLFSHVDDDGLLRMQGLDARPDMLVDPGSAVQYHPLLRRLWGSQHPQLIARLLDAGERTGNVLRVAVDEKRLCPSNELWTRIVKDFWYGCPFGVESLDDPSKVDGVEYRRPGGKVGIGPYTALQVAWHIDGDGHKVAKVEELVDPNEERSPCPYVLLRYLHAIRDMQRGVFIHLDAAVRAFTPQEYASRESMNVRDAHRAGRYRKVFRIDGAIDTDRWKDIVGRWFIHNELACEFLSGKRTVSQP